MRVRLSDQKGQTASEYVGLLLLVGVLVFAFGQLNVGGRIGAAIEQKICEIARVGCPGPSHASTGARASSGTRSAGARTRSASGGGAPTAARSAQARSAGARSAKAKASKRQREPKLIKARHFKYPFQNFDYDEKSGKRDMPVTIIFISKKPDMVDRLYGQLKQKADMKKGGDKMRLRGVGGSRKGVNSRDPWESHSSGRKGAFGCYGHCSKKTDIHMRTYGPDGRKGTQVYQGNYGYAPYYLVATTHFDRDEHGPKRGFGWSDTARDILVNEMVRQGQWHVVGKTNVHNACHKTVDVHVCQSDGKALIVSID